MASSCICEVDNQESVLALFIYMKIYEICWHIFAHVSIVYLDEPLPWPLYASLYAKSGTARHAAVGH